MAKKAPSAKAAEKKPAAPKGKRQVRKKKGGPDPIDVHVGSRLRLRRMILGVSQDALGRSLDLTFQQIQKYEKGANRIGAGRLMQLAEILEVPIQFFYDDYDGMIGSSGLAETDGKDAFMELLNSPEGIQLCRYFSLIEDPKVKKRVIDLVRSISETETGAR